LSTKRRDIEAHVAQQAEHFLGKEEVSGSNPDVGSIPSSIAPVLFRAGADSSNVDLTVLLPLLSSILAFVFAALVFDQWLRRRRAYQLVWSIGLVWYGLATTAEFAGAAFGWNELLYRSWYLTGAVWVAAWLGLGTVYLLARTRFGFGFAAALLLAALFTLLTQRRYEYPEAGAAPLLYGAVALVVAVVVVALSLRRDERWAHFAALVIGGGTLASAAMMFTIQLPAPGYSLDPATRIPVGDLFPGYLRLLTPFFNITGAFALVFGAAYSAYVFMPKRRAIRYSLRGGQGPAAWLANLALAPVAIVVNFVASVPGALTALLRGQLNSRVPATLLIAIGGFIPAVTSGLIRFGITWGHELGLFIGLLLIFIGFLISLEVFSDVRLPGTRVVLRRRTDAAEASVRGEPG
jgi:hypothetical protein